jgi:hypothetical protein
VKKQTFVYGVKTALNPRRIYSCVSWKQVDNQEIELFCHVLRNWAVLHLTLFYLEMSETQIMHLSNTHHLCKSRNNRYIDNATVCSTPFPDTNLAHKKYQDEKLMKSLAGTNLNELNLKVTCIQLRK